MRHMLFIFFFILSDVVEDVWTRDVNINTWSKVTESNIKEDVMVHEIIVTISD